MVNAFQRLLGQPSFSLQRVSPQTFPGDVITTHVKRGEKLTDREAEALIALIRGGTCFRCKLGKGPYHYGKTADLAIEAALAEKSRARKKRNQKPDRG